jgi:hypothetical protein
MKLIKITEDNYIIVDNSEIKEGDYYLFTWGGEQEIQRFFKEQYADRENHKHLYDTACKKITHSTQPLELLSENGLSGMGFSKVRPLNIFEIKELIGEVDVEKKSENLAKSLYDKSKHEDWDIYNSLVQEDAEMIKLGYNQALEDNKDKKYTEKDVIRIVEKSRETGLTAEYLILSLQPKTEWEVEFVNGKIKLK